MKEKIGIIKTCVKDGNISPQLDNIEFTFDSITAYKDGNLIVTNNNTPIRGYVNGKSFIKAVETFKEPTFVDTEKSVLIKEGKRKVTIAKYILSGGESTFELPKSENEIVEILLNEPLFNAIKLCMYSASGNNINASGDGIIIDFSEKFKKVYASNGTHMTVSNVFSKGKFKVFIPYFIVESISKYYTPNSTIKVTDTYVKYDNNDYQFISLYSITDEITDINNVISNIEIIAKNVKITDEINESIKNTTLLTDKAIIFEFKKGFFNIYGSSENSEIEDSFKMDNKVDASIRLHKDHVKYAIKNFDSFDLCKLKDSDINFIKFKAGKTSFYISPLVVTQTEVE